MTNTMQFSEVAENMHAVAGELAGRAEMDRADILAEIRDSAPDDDDSHGWPGDGSGEDDLADYNANEADDYAHEGAEDSYLDASYEDRSDIDYMGE